MSFIAVVLLTFAAFFHAAWNLVSKQHSPCSAFFLAANLWGALIFLPVVIFCWQQPLSENVHTFEMPRPGCWHFGKQYIRSCRHGNQALVDWV